MEIRGKEADGEAENRGDCPGDQFLLLLLHLGPVSVKSQLKHKTSSLTH